MDTREGVEVNLRELAAVSSLPLTLATSSASLYTLHSVLLVLVMLRL